MLTIRLAFLVKVDMLSIKPHDMVRSDQARCHNQ